MTAATGNEKALAQVDQAIAARTGKEDGDALFSENRFAEAEGNYREGLAIARQPLGRLPVEDSSLVGALAAALFGQRKRVETEKVLDEVIAAGIGKPDSHATNLREKSGFLAQHGHPNAAAACLAKAVQRQPEEHWNWYFLPPLLAESSDTAGYRKICNAMLARFGGTTNAAIAERTAKVCLLLPLDGADLTAASKLAETAVTFGKDDAWVAYYQFAKGLAEYRQANFPQAIEWTQNAVSQPGINYNRDIQAYSVLAMALHRLNKAGEASEALSKATGLAGTKLPRIESGDLGPNWHDWIITHALLREAKAIIEGSSRAGDGTK